VRHYRIQRNHRLVFSLVLVGCSSFIVLVGCSPLLSLSDFSDVGLVELVCVFVECFFSVLQMRFSDFCLMPRRTRVLKSRTMEHFNMISATIASVAKIGT